MKKLLSLLLLVFCIWIVTLRDGRVYTSKDVQAGRWGVTIVQEDGTKITFHWFQIKSVEHKSED